MPETLTPWRWAGRALVTGLGLVVAGWLLGGGLGLLHPIAGMAGGALLLFLGGGGWASHHIGLPGFGAALLGVLTAIGAAHEGSRAWVVTRHPIVERASITDGSLASGATLLHVRPLQYLPDAEATVTGRYVSGVSDRGVERHSHFRQTAMPLSETAGGPVVAFDCYGKDESRGDGGAFVLSLAAVSTGDDAPCQQAVEAVREKLAAAKLRVAPGAEQRIVRAFRSEAELRAAHDLQAALEVPLKAFVLYGILVVLFRRRGADAYARG